MICKRPGGVQARVIWNERIHLQPLNKATHRTAANLHHPYL